MTEIREKIAKTLCDFGRLCTIHQRDKCEHNATRKPSPPDDTRQEGRDASEMPKMRSNLSL